MIAPTIQSVRYAQGTGRPEDVAPAARALVQIARHTAPLNARLIGSRIREFVEYGSRPLTERQLSNLLDSIRNTVPVAVQFARVAIEAARPVVPPRAYVCNDCQREQDIDGTCITCGLPVVATIGRAA